MPEIIIDDSRVCEVARTYREAADRLCPIDGVPPSAVPKPIARLVIRMDTHDMGQSLAPNPPFKSHRIMVTDWTAAEALPLGTYELVLANTGRVSEATQREGWIAVNERLPEGEDAVTCEAWCTGDEGMPPGPLIVQFDPDEEPSMQWQSREDTGCWTIGQVTHWRPRPTGPSGVQANPGKGI